MVDFRYHVVSIIAVFLALGTGIVLGSTTLDDVFLNQVRGTYEQERRDRIAYQAKAEDLQRQLDHRDDFERAIAGPVVRGHLSGQRTTVIAAPDADRRVRDEVVRMLQLAGSEVASSPGTSVGGVRLSRKYADPTPAVQAELDDLVTDPDLLPPGFSFPDIASATDRPALLLAALLVRPVDADRRAAKPAEVTTALTALSSAGMLSVDGSMPLPATLIVVVLPKDPAPKAPESPSSAVTPYSAELALVRALQATGRPVLVVAPRLGAAEDTALAAVRKDPTLAKGVSTVDNADTTAGQISLVLALEQQLAGTVGHFGEGGGAEAMVPSPSPTPTADP